MWWTLPCYSSCWLAGGQQTKKVFISCCRAGKMVNFWAVTNHLTWHYADIAKFSWGDITEWTFLGKLNTKCHTLNVNMHEYINKYMCHRLRIWVMEMMTWFFHSGRKYNWWGCQQVCRQTSMALLHMHNAFLAEMGSRWLWHHLIMS